MTNIGARNTSLKAGPYIFFCWSRSLAFLDIQDKNKEMRSDRRELLPVVPESEMGEKEESRETGAYYQLIKFNSRK